MADWLVIVPPVGGAAVLPDLAMLARALRVPSPDMLRQTNVEGALFVTAAEAQDDPGVVIVRGDGAIDGTGYAAVTASALLTERDDLVTALREHERAVGVASPDGALLAEAVGVWGEETWSRPGGEFAVAAWLPARRTVLLATDGEGARPAYWADTHAGFIASTRFEVMMVLPGVSRQPDRGNVLQCLGLVRNTPESGRTWLSAVEELPSGHALRWRDGVIERRRWWTFPTDVPCWRPRGEREAVECFRWTLRQSIHERVRGHRRVSIALSGGMDSTAVAAEAVALRDTGVDLQLTAIHAEYPRELRSPEAELAHQTATALGIPFVRVSLESVPVWPLPAGMGVWPPHHWFGLWPPLQGMLARYGTTVLAGTSGEIFSMASLADACDIGRPDDLLAAWAMFRRLRLPFRPWRRGLWRRQAYPFAAAVLPLPVWVRRDAIAAYGVEDTRHALAQWRPPPSIPRRFCSLYAFLTLMRRSGQLADIGATRLPMLNPFVDRRVVRLAVAVQPVPWRMQKCLVRRAFGGVLPAAVLQRPRQSTPWLAGPFLRSPAARLAAQEPLHPVLAELVDEARWREAVGGLVGMPDGHAWLSVLMVNAWLYAPGFSS